MAQPPQNFGELLREHRHNAGMTQQELARRAGMSVRALRDIERGRVERPRIDSARRLSAALGRSGSERDRLLAAAAVAAGDARARVDVLGPLAVWLDNVPIEIRSPKLRCLLGLLAVQPGQVVPIGEVIDVLWGERPPETSVSSVHTYVRQLRALLEPARRHRAPARVLVLGRSGYRLVLGGQQSDLARFDGLVALAGTAREAGDVASAERLYAEALGCWRGSVLADMPLPLRQHPAVVAASNRRIAATIAYADLAVDCSRHHERAAGFLGVLCGTEPLHEGLHARHMLALAGCGQRIAALDVFTAIRSRLGEDLGVEPGAELHQAHVRILRQEQPRVSRAGQGEPVSPAQLPAAVPDFTGRDAQVRDLTALTSTRDGHPVPATVVAITGTAGVGKTALAVHWSHQVRDRFPDGQLYVDLRGHSPVPPLRPVDALVRFLHALGVPAQQIPPEEGEAVGLYRSLLADRRILVVLDNAANSEQVRPLLPGGRECLALVTSRNRLSSLLAREGARRVALTVLTPAEAYTLLARILGPDHVAAEPEQTAELARMCAHLPLALRIAAARVANDPHGGLAAYLADLRHSDDRLAAFEVDEDTQAAVRATFHLSYASLADPPRRLFRLLGLVPGPNVTAEAAAALIDAPVRGGGPAAGPVGRLPSGRATRHLAGSPATTCSGCTRASAPKPRTTSRGGRRPYAGCSTTTCGPSTRRRVGSIRTSCGCRRRRRPCRRRSPSPITRRRWPGWTPSDPT